MPYRTTTLPLPPSRAAISIVVRIPEIRREAIMKPLDSGAAGLLVPMVNTADQAKEIMTYQSEKIKI